MVSQTCDEEKALTGDPVGEAVGADPSVVATDVVQTRPHLHLFTAGDRPAIHQDRRKTAHRALRTVAGVWLVVGNRHRVATEADGQAVDVVILVALVTATQEDRTADLLHHGYDGDQQEREW